MSKVEFYSILLTHEFGASWKLEGYKRHALSGKFAFFRGGFFTKSMLIVVMPLLL